MTPDATSTKPRRHERVTLSLNVISAEFPAGGQLPLDGLAQVAFEVRAALADQVPVEDGGETLSAHVLPLRDTQLAALRTYMAYLTATPRHLHAPEVRAFIDGFFEAERR